MQLIHVKDVFFRYPGAKTDAIHNMSFDVTQGEIFGFLGPSGAGKSTLQKILTGVHRQYSGSVKVFQAEIKNRKSDYYENIGVDFEFPNFYLKFTALENLRYFASLYKSETLDLMALFAKVGLENDVNKKVGSYSKGMKMRLGFIRALMHNPPLLFLDEPTSGLDPANARIMKDMIIEQKHQGKTIILTTHNMHDAEELCDRVAFVVDGKLEALGAPQALRHTGAETKVEYAFALGEEELHGACLLSELNSSVDFQAAMQNGTLKRIHSKEQTLEDVFISLTGRHLQ